MGIDCFACLPDRRLVRVRGRANCPFLARRAQPARGAGVAAAFAEPWLRRIRRVADGRRPRGVAREAAAGADHLRAGCLGDRPAALRQLLAALVAAQTVASARRGRPARLHGRAPAQRRPRRAGQARLGVGDATGGRSIRRAVRLFRPADRGSRRQHGAGRRAGRPVRKPWSRSEKDHALGFGKQRDGTAHCRTVRFGDPCRHGRPLHAWFWRRRDEPHPAAHERIRDRSRPPPADHSAGTDQLRAPGSEPPQERVPRQHEPRAAHAPERDHRFLRAPHRRARGPI